MVILDRRRGLLHWVLPLLLLLLTLHLIHQRRDALVRRTQLRERRIIMPILRIPSVLPSMAAVSVVSSEANTRSRLFIDQSGAVQLGKN
jgi:hypothetical protein